jgi:hypothetical protein
MVSMQRFGNSNCKNFSIKDLSKESSKDILKPSTPPEISKSFAAIEHDDQEKKPQPFKLECEKQGYLISKAKEVKQSDSDFEAKKTTEAVIPPEFKYMPPEVLLRVFKHLDPKSAYGLALVNKALYGLSQDKELIEYRNACMKAYIKYISKNLKQLSKAEISDKVFNYLKIVGVDLLDDQMVSVCLLFLRSENRSNFHDNCTLSFDKYNKTMPMRIKKYNQNYLIKWLNKNSIKWTLNYSNDEWYLGLIRMWELKTNDDFYAVTIPQKKSQSSTYCTLF